MWNKAYVTAHFPKAYADRRNGRGRAVIGWFVHVPKRDISGMVRWNFSGLTAEAAWKSAAEAIENVLRKRGRR